jgi:DnaJ-class molecular chaperone
MKITQVTCPECAGATRVRGRECGGCDGNGLVAWDEEGRWVKMKKRVVKKAGYGRNVKENPLLSGWKSEGN